MPSAREKPVISTTAPAIAVATNANRSVSTCWNAPSTLRLRRPAPASSIVAARFTAMPTIATTSTTPPSVSGGSIRRWIAATAITTASATSVAPFSCADRISARRKPNVKPPRAGRCASRAANSASAIAPASVSMCAASESSASEEARMPAAISTAIRPRISASAPVRRLVSSVWTCVCAWAWSCMAPVG